MYDNLKLIISDVVVFWVFQVVLYLVFVFSLYKDIFKEKIGVEILLKRGKDSRDIFILTGSAAINTLIVVIFSISEVPENSKLFLYLINVAIILYLFFFSNWFTNRLIGFYTWHTNKNFSPNKH